MKVVIPYCAIRLCETTRMGGSLRQKPQTGRDDAPVAEQPAPETLHAEENDRHARQSSLERKALDDSGDSAAVQHSDPSASSAGPRKPPFAQDEDNDL